MRTNKAEVIAVFKNWVAAIGGRIAKDWKDVGAYRLDHNSCYGGWRVERVCNVHGGVHDVFTQRLPAGEFVTALRMAQRSIEELRFNTK